MIIRTIPHVEDLAVPMPPSDDSVRDDDYLPGTEDWAVLESMRLDHGDAHERDAEDERFVALMLGGDAFD